MIALARRGAGGGRAARGRTIDLGHLGLAREVLSALELPDEALAEARRCIAQARRRGLGRACSQSARGSKAGDRVRARCCPSWRAAPARARRRAARRRRAAASGARWPSWPPSSRRSDGARLDARLHVDLGEVRGFDYYTGVRFQAFVPGAPDAGAARRPLRDLLARYGRPSPAVGFAVDVEAVAGALRASAGAPRRTARRAEAHKRKE